MKTTYISAFLVATIAGLPAAYAQDEPTPGTETPEAPEAATGGDSYGGPPPLENIPEAELTAEPHLRKGFLGGAAFGFGSVKTSCDVGQGCGHFGGVGFSFDGGWAFSPKFAVVGELWFTGGLSGDEAGQLWTLSANARYWVAERFWIQGGLALSWFDYYRRNVSGSVASGDGGGLVLGAGAELWRSNNGHLVVDLRAKLALLGVKGDNLGDGASGNSTDTRQTTAMVTISWY